MPSSDYTRIEVKPWGAQKRDDDLRAFMIVLRRALLMVVRYIEQRYAVTE